MTLIQKQYARATRQMRGFILIWTFVTLVMGLATFMAIYFTYAPPGGDDEDPTVLFQPGAQAVVLASSTPLPTAIPTSTPLATNTPLPEPTTVAQVATDVPVNTAVPTLQPTIPPAQDKRFALGIQVQYSLDLNPDNQDGFFNTVYNDMSLRWVKHQVRWENLEPERGQFDWSTLDIAMTSARKFGLKMMLSVVTAPAWARESGVNTSRHGPPASNADYVNFVTQILKRYPGQVHAMEIWNEMNLDREWTSLKGLSATNYTALLHDTFNAVKAIDPGVIVISGALSPTGVDDGIGAIDDFRYTDLMIQAGALNYMDCFGAHHNGYNMPPTVRYNEGYNDPKATFRGPFDNPHHSWSFRSTLEGYAQRISSAGKDTKLCITEFGWPVTEDLSGSPEGFGFANDNTLAEQENWMRDAMTFMDESGYVWLAFIWNFNYGPQAGWDPKNDNVPYSLIGPDWKYRPAYYTISGWQWDYLLRTGQAEPVDQ